MVSLALAVLVCVAAVHRTEAASTTEDPVATNVTSSDVTTTDSSVTSDATVTDAATTTTDDATNTTDNAITTTDDAGTTTIADSPTSDATVTIGTDGAITAATPDAATAVTPDAATAATTDAATAASGPTAAGDATTAADSTDASDSTSAEPTVSGDATTDPSSSDGVTATGTAEESTTGSPITLGGACASGDTCALDGSRETVCDQTGSCKLKEGQDCSGSNAGNCVAGAECDTAVSPNVCKCEGNLTPDGSTGKCTGVAEAYLGACPQSGGSDAACNETERLECVGGTCLCKQSPAGGYTHNMTDGSCVVSAQRVGRACDPDSSPEASTSCGDPATTFLVCLTDEAECACKSGYKGSEGEACTKINNGASGLCGSLVSLAVAGMLQVFLLH